MQERTPADKEKEPRIRHNTWVDGQPVAIDIDQRGRETINRRKLESVDPHELGRTQDRRLRK